MFEICFLQFPAPGDDGIEADHAQNPGEGIGGTGTARFKKRGKRRSAWSKF